MTQFEKQLKSIYLSGGIFAIIFLAGTILDIIIGSIVGADLNMLPKNAVERFTQFNNNVWLGLYNLDFLNLITSLIMFPIFFTLFTAHNHLNPVYSKLAMLVFLIGTTFFIVNNAALPMLDLSHQYSAATDSDKLLIASAGEALLAKGAHSSPGIFPGFALISISEILISFVMLSAGIFSKATSYIGITGNSLLLLYVIFVTFIPGMKSSAMLLAMPGGLLSMVWIVMFTARLFQLRSSIS
ncbi:MAG: DUF4386 family protein [Bacteroidetes bacterium]|nr:MAG: DUF4386 family protein [Bacteroidota bacterium]